MHTPSKRAQAARLLFSGPLGLLALLAGLIGHAAYITMLLFPASVFIIIGGQRDILRAAVKREGQRIVCRFAPWFDSTSIALCLLLPLTGVGALTATPREGIPGWLRAAGSILLAIGFIFIVGNLRLWRRCVFSISGPELMVRGAIGARNATVVPVGAIKSVDPKEVVDSARTRTTQVEVIYDAAGRSETISLGPQATVRSPDLAKGRAIWWKSADRGPEMLDRVERIPRDRDRP